MYKILATRRPLVLGILQPVSTKEKEEKRKEEEEEEKEEEEEEEEERKKRDYQHNEWLIPLLYHISSPMLPANTTHRSVAPAPH